MCNRPSFSVVTAGRLLLTSIWVSATVLAACAADSTYTFTHLAGPIGGPGSADGVGAAARFVYPQSVAVDQQGTVYVADTWNSTIRRIAPNGTVTTFAGRAAEPGSTNGTGPAARFNRPAGIAVDADGVIYVADTGNHTIRRISPAGVVTTFAGTAGESGTTDGPGAEARFDGPAGLAFDANGNVFVADAMNHTIRKITPAGDVFTLAGTPGQSGSADGTGTAASFNRPTGVAVGADGTIWVADNYNDTIRKVTPTGVVSTFAGQAGSAGQDNGSTDVARFEHPTAIALDGDGNAFIADSGNSAIRRITPAGLVQTIAGGGGAGNRDGEFALNINPPGTRGVAFRFASGIAVAGTGEVYIADEQNHTIRKLVFTSAIAGNVTTLAGQGATSGSADGMAAAASFNWPQGVAVSEGGITYVADTLNNTIRKITASGDVTTFAGEPMQSGHINGQGSEARFSSPLGIGVDASGTVYVAESSTIRKISPAGAVSEFVGSATEAGHVDGTGGAARVQPTGRLAVDQAGNIYFAEGTSRTIRKVTPQGVVTTLAGAVGEAGTADGAGTSARFSLPLATAVDGTGNVYVADSASHTIRKITPGGAVTTLAGKAGEKGDADGIGVAARFSYPMGIAADAVGTVYVADTDNHTIRAITPAGVVTTIGGVALYPANNDGVGTAARFYRPTAIAVNAAGDLFIADTFNHGIRKGAAAKASPVISWPEPGGFAHGTALTAAVLNATANVPGTFTYAPATGTVLPVGEQTVKLTFAPDDTVHYALATAERTLAVFAVKPVFTGTPQNQVAAAGASVTLTAAASGSSEMNYRWWRNGVSTSMIEPTLTIARLQPADTGLYVVEAEDEAGETWTEPAIVGLSATEKTTGDGDVRGTGIRHPNGNYYDQVLLTGPAVTITAEPGKVTRTSFLDLDGDIVQIEFAGAGSLSVVLAAAKNPAAPQKYNQPDVAYVQGHAGIVIVGANETTNVSVFTVGRATAFDPTGAYDLTKSISATNDPAKNGNPLFQGHETTDYDGIADIAFIAISSTNGKFGGVRTANTIYQDSVGTTGLYAPGVDFLGPVFMGDIRAAGNASPVILLGGAENEVRITGGDMWQGNGSSVQVSGLTKLKFTAGSDSHGHELPAQQNRGALWQNGTNVTGQIVENP